VKVTLARTADAVHFDVQDNGHGVAPELLDDFADGSWNNGVGLAGMRERLSDVDGQTKVESSSQGTILRVTVPLAGADRLARSASP
jgi:signal transduction histidine kinase